MIISNTKHTEIIQTSFFKYYENVKHQRIRITTPTEQTFLRSTGFFSSQIGRNDKYFQFRKEITNCKAISQYNIKVEMVAPTKG